MAGVWGRDDFCSPPLLLFLSCRSSPPDCIFGMGARQLGCRFYTIWHLPRGFLNLMHSGFHFSQGHMFLCLLGPSQLLWPAITFCPKELCRCWAQVAHRKMFPGIPRGTFFATTPLGRVSPTPFVLFLWLFSHHLLEFRYKNLAMQLLWVADPTTFAVINPGYRKSEIRFCHSWGVPKYENGLVTSRAARFFLAKEGKGCSSGP